jgi:DnaJ-class molecular chaperone
MAKYFQKRYKTITDKSLGTPSKRCGSCEGSGLAHDENGCEVDDVCEECAGSGSAVGENE